MKLKLKIHTFKDTMNPGYWIATVNTRTVDGQEHGFYVESETEQGAMIDALEGIGEFLLKVQGIKA